MGLNVGIGRSADPAPRLGEHRGHRSVCRGPGQNPFELANRRSIVAGGEQMLTERTADRDVIGEGSRRRRRT